MRDRHWSEQVAKQAVKLGGMIDFEGAAEILSEVGQIEISASSVWRLTQKWGEKLKVLEEKEQEQANAVPSGREIQPGLVRQNKRMGLSMDGIIIYIRGEEWKELKIGCVSDVVLRPVRDAETQEWIEQGHAIHNTYTCHLGGPETFGQKVWTEIQRRDWQKAVETEALGDGAAWIWNLVDSYCYDSYQVVDWFHAKEHLARAAQLAYGEGTPAHKRWLKEQGTLLFQGQAEEVAREISHLAEERPAIRESLLAEAGYFEHHKRRMNYMEMREEGWIIGSGVVESGGKQYKARFCGSGMRWSRPGAENLLPIRTAILSKRFPELWKRIYKSPIN
jgi:hypothetical protein